MTRKTVLIADDHPIFRRGLRSLVEEQGAFEVVAEVADGREALAALRALRPDIAVLDVSMPEVDGLDLLAQARGWPDPPAIVLLTLYDDYVEQAMQAGAHGYLLKENAADDLVRCLVAVAAGERFVSPGLTWPAGGDDVAPAGHLSLLTPSELRVLRLVGRLHTNPEIAGLLSVSVRTIQNHRAHICRKLGLSGSKALLRFALARAGER